MSDVDSHDSFPCQWEKLPDSVALCLAGRLAMGAIETSAGDTHAAQLQFAARRAVDLAEADPAASDLMQAVHGLLSTEVPNPRVLQCAANQAAGLCIGAACEWPRSGSLD